MENKSELGILEIFVLVLLAIWVFFVGKKHKKQDVASFYNVSKPTLAKWIDYFHQTTTLEEWNKKRYLTTIEFDTIKKFLGSDAGMVYSKADIARIASSTYKVVSAEVLNNSEKLGITQIAWKNCNTFPPAVSRAILDHLG